MCSSRCMDAARPRPRGRAGLRPRSRTGLGSRRRGCGTPPAGPLPVLEQRAQNVPVRSSAGARRGAGEAEHGADGEANELHRTRVPSGIRNRGRRAFASIWEPPELPWRPVARVLPFVLPRDELLCFSERRRDGQSRPAAFGRTQLMELRHQRASGVVVHLPERADDAGRSAARNARARLIAPSPRCAAPTPDSQAESTTRSATTSVASTSANRPSSLSVAVSARAHSSGNRASGMP